MTEAHEPVAGGTPASPPWAWITSGIAIAAIAIMGAILWRTKVDVPPEPAASPIQITALTNTHDSSLPALSHDGRFVAFVRTDDARASSIWIRQLASDSATKVVGSMPGISILAVAVTPDNRSIDYVRDSAKGSPRLELWRVPVRGGRARKLVDRITSAPGWAPDGRRMAYIANVGADNRSRQLIVASADGSQPRTIATRTLPLRYNTLSMTGRPDLRPVWLTDGRTIALIASDDAKGLGCLQIIGIDVTTGSERMLHSLPENRASMARSAIALTHDGRAFVLNMQTDPSGPAQVVRLQMSNGTITKLTSDRVTYAGVSIAGDAIASSRAESRSTLWVSEPDGKRARQVGQEIPGRIETLGWIGNERVTYDAALAEGTGVWSTDLATGESMLRAEQGTAPSRTGDRNRTPDGRGYAYVDGSGTNIWIQPLDGTAPRRLTQFEDQIITSFAWSPDGSQLAVVRARETSDLVLLRGTP
jgi:Tol biopolymer transport system component